MERRVYPFPSFRILIGDSFSFRFFLFLFLSLSLSLWRFLSEFFWQYLNGSFPHSFPRFFRGFFQVPVLHFLFYRDGEDSSQLFSNCLTILCPVINTLIWSVLLLLLLLLLFVVVWDEESSDLFVWNPRQESSRMLAKILQVPRCIHLETPLEYLETIWGFSKILGAILQHKGRKAPSPGDACRIRRGILSRCSNPLKDSLDWLFVERVSEESVRSRIFPGIL